MSSLLDAYFKTNKEMTEKVLKNKIPLWRNQSLIDVAGDIGQKSIIGKPGCQSVLAKRWKEVVFFQILLNRKAMVVNSQMRFHPTHVTFYYFSSHFIVFLIFLVSYVLCMSIRLLFSHFAFLGR